jgi:3-hydroxy-5-methyl-1-naphthoate 3-O-methyltransferase
VAVLRFFIQVLGRDSARRVLANLAKALRPGGAIIIVDHLLEDDRLSPQQAMGQSLVMLTIYDEGQAYTEAEYRAWLSESDFSDIRIEFSVAPGGASIISACNAPEPT